MKIKSRKECSNRIENVNNNCFSLRKALGFELNIKLFCVINEYPFSHHHSLFIFSPR